MKIEVFPYLPQEAAKIRQKVFIEEQGFQVEFDDVDRHAVHLVLFDDLELPVATCRVFQHEGTNTYLLGRLAVLKESRGNNFGALIVKKAEEYVKKIGGKTLQLHAQCSVSPFYEKLGFSSFGEIAYEEWCPHIWMKKEL